MVTPEKLREWASLMSHLGAVMHQVGDSEICVDVAVAAQEMFDAAHHVECLSLANRLIRFGMNATSEQLSAAGFNGIADLCPSIATEEFGAGVFN